MSLTEHINTLKSNESMHVDDFINHGSKPSGNAPTNEAYARWVLNHFRLSAICKWAFDEFMEPHKLFCLYKGKKFRVIGASRLGDIWLTSKFDKNTGYEHRVLVESCSNWTKC